MENERSCILLVHYCLVKVYCYTRTPSEGSRVTARKPNSLFPLEVKQMIFGGVGQAEHTHLGLGTILNLAKETKSKK